jgi:hypothetical protein
MTLTTKELDDLELRLAKRWPPFQMAPGRHEQLKQLITMARQVAKSDSDKPQPDVAGLMSMSGTP